MASAGGAAKGISGALGGAEAVIGAVVGQFGELEQTLQSLVGTIGHFVDALSPSTMQAFGQAIRDVQATIGSAFVGVAQVFTSVAREVGGVLLPLMQQLGPILTTLANAVATQFVAGVRLAAAALEALAPVLDVVAGVQEEYAKLLSDMTAVVTVAVRVFADLVGSLLGGLGGGLKDAFKAFVDVIRQVVKALTTLIATVAVYLGFSDTVKKFAAGLDREARDREARAPGLRAAASNPAFADVGELMKRAQLAAFTAAGGAGARAKTDTEWLKEMSGDLKTIASRDSSLSKSLEEWFRSSPIGQAINIFFTWVNGIAESVKRFFR